MILDIICAGVVLLFGLIGLFRGFARQIFGILSGFVALIGAYLLLKPAYEIVCELFLASIIKSIGGSLSSLTFLDSVAIPAGKTTGILLAEYASIFVCYVVLVFLVGIAWKLLKSIVYPICDVKGIRFFDKTFGFALGCVWGILLVVGLLYVATLVAGFEKLGLTATINDLLASLSADSFFSEKYILSNMGKIETYFADVWNLICKGFSKIKAA